jgi:hypothetical protein
MNIVEQNIVKFVDSLIVDDFSTAHKFLENVINEKIKETIKEAAKTNPFKKKNDDSKKSKKAKSKKAKSKKAKSKKEKSAETAFGKFEFAKFKKGGKKK